MSTNGPKLAGNRLYSQASELCDLQVPRIIRNNKSPVAFMLKEVHCHFLPRSFREVCQKQRHFSIRRLLNADVTYFYCFFNILQQAWPLYWDCSPGKSLNDAEVIAVKKVIRLGAGKLLVQLLLKHKKSHPPLWMNFEIGSRVLNRLYGKISYTQQCLPTILLDITIYNLNTKIWKPVKNVVPASAVTPLKPVSPNRPTNQSGKGQQ